MKVYGTAVSRNKSPVTRTASAYQVGIIERLISHRVNVIAISPIKAEVVKPTLGRASVASIPVIVVNLLEPTPGMDVSSYIRFDNAQGATVIAY